MPKALTFSELNKGAEPVPYMDDPQSPKEFVRIPKYTESGRLCGFSQPMHNPLQLPGDDEVVKITTYDPTNPVNAVQYARDQIAAANSHGGVVHETTISAAEKMKAYVNESETN